MVDGPARRLGHRLRYPRTVRLRAGNEIVPTDSFRRGVPDECCAPKALDFFTTGLPWGIAVTVIVVAAVLGIAVLLVRRLLVRRALAHRVEYDWLPTNSFDPSAEDVSRFAAQLTRTRPAESRLRPRRGASVRLSMRTDPSGRLLLRIGGPVNAGSVLRHQSYPQVESRGPDREQRTPPE